MSSLKERMKVMKSVEIESDEQCFIDVKFKGIPIAKILVNINRVQLDTMNSAKNKIQYTTSIIIQEEEGNRQ